VSVGSAVAGALWPHQVEAVGAVTQAVGRGGRTTLDMACGTGKTRIGGAVCAELGSSRRVLVLVPTIELLVQTLDAYRAVADSPLGTVVAVCSDPTIAERQLLADEPDVVVTTTSDVLAEAARVGGRVTVLSTYASLPVVATAHAHHDLAEWDLVVIDEAHRTTGRVDGPWKLVHHDAQVPAKRRLYMTATPRVATTSGDDVVSMDDPRIYGETCYRLPFSRAIGMGLLADYRVVVPVVTSEEVHRLTTDEGLQLRLGGSVVPPATLAGQIAVLRTMNTYGVKRAISYHHRVSDAKFWARTLPSTAELMPGGAIDLWSGHVSGVQPPHLRRRVIDRLAEPGDELAVVSNARVLNEGVDVPVVDAVVFAKPRRSAIDTVQAVGRALRTGGQRDKVATIVVPLLLADGESPEAALESSEWEPVWQVLRALRDHDDRLDEQLRLRRTQLGEDQLFNITPSRETMLPSWLQVEGVEVSDEFARAITIRAVRSATPSWDEYYGAARAYAQTQGNLDMPSDWITAEGLRVGDWLRRQKVYYNAGDLTAERTELLEKLGIVWNELEENWMATYEEAKEFADRNGHLDVPDEVVTRRGIVLANWLQAQRTRRNQGKVSAERIALLDAIGMPWDGVWERWMRRWRELKAIYDRRGSLLRLPGDSREAIWLEGQRATYRRGQLTDEQVRLLAEIGVDVTEDRRMASWRNSYEELKAFHAEEGHWSVPDEYRTLDGVNLKSWKGAQRTARRDGRLAEEKVRLLDRIGFPWDPNHERWEARYAELARFFVTHWHLTLPSGPLSSWRYQQAKKRRLGTLSDEAASRLDGIHPLWHDERAVACSEEVRRRFTLTDCSWRRIRELLPEAGDGRSRMWNTADHRAVIEAIIWKLRTGARWDDMPEECGSPVTISGWWRQWEADGLWAEIESHIELRGPSTE
jgi:superfamily II DNA or RNA helicase